jgi:hypothetical protein
MRILSAAGAALMFLNLSAGAGAADIKILTADTLTAIATAAGGTNIQRKDSGDGQALIVFQLEGKTYVFSLELCDKDDKSKCGAVLMATGLKGSASDTHEIINDFNATVGFLTAVKLGDVIAFGRYVVVLGGISAENTGVNFGLVTLAQDLYAEFLKSRVVASTGAPGQVLLSQPDAAPAVLQPVALTPEQMKSMANDAFAAKIKLK